MKNKIVIFMPTIGIGGVEKNFFIISNYLAKIYSNISVTSLSNQIKYKLDNKIEFIGPNSNFFEKYSRRIKFLIALVYLVKKIIQNKKITVVCFQANMYCVFICKLLGAKVILRSNSSPEGWSKNIFKLKLYELGFKLADGIIVNSLNFKKQLKTKFNVSATCIYNPINKKDIIKLSKKKVRLNFFNKKTLNMISVARFEDQKDHLTLLKAVNKLKSKIDFKLLLIGSGSREKLIKNFIKQNKLEKSIKLIKNIQNPFPYILKSDLVLLTSIYEGLPNILLESIVLNKFIISSNCPTGPSEILSYGKGGFLFKVGDYNELSNKILIFKNKQKQLKSKIIFAQKNLKKFEYEFNLKKYKKFIDKFI